MALVIGNSTAGSGAAKRIWDALSVEGMPGAKQLNENDDSYELRINNLKMMCFAITTGIIEEILANLEIKGVKVVLDTSLNQVFSAGVPVPMDGGAVLQTCWKAATMAGIADKATQNNDGKGLVA